MIPYEITIRPLSAFGTPIKGDTIFGQFCWQVVHKPHLVKGGIEGLVERYKEQPFAVFSSAFPKFEGLRGDTTYYAFPRPQVPLSWLCAVKSDSRTEQYKATSDVKARKWFLMSDEFSFQLSSLDLITEYQIHSYGKKLMTNEALQQTRGIKIKGIAEVVPQPHNTINRITTTTGIGQFAPYSKENIWYLPETELALFVLVDEDQTQIERIVEGLEEIGKCGFGRDASTGLGRFDVCEWTQMALPKPAEASACYTLAPCVPQKGAFLASYFMPFIRYGKHGDRLAITGNPFKNPVIMADEAAVFVPRDSTIFDKPYIGVAVTGVSKAESNTIVQGYSPYFPFRLEY